MASRCFCFLQLACGLVALTAVIAMLIAEMTYLSTRLHWRWEWEDKSEQSDEDSYYDSDSSDSDYESEIKSFLDEKKGPIATQVPAQSLNYLLFVTVMAALVSNSRAHCE